MLNLIENIQKVQTAIYSPKNKASNTAVNLLEGLSTVFWNLNNWISILKEEDHISAFWDDLNTEFRYCQNNHIN